MSMRVFFTALFTLALCAPSNALGQDPPFGFELRAGFVSPTSELGRTEVLQGAGYVVFDEPGTAATLGGAVLARVSGPWSLRVSVDHQFDTDVDGAWYCAPFVACPAVLIEPEGQLRRWVLGADVRLRALSVPGPVQPVVFAGGGVRWSRLRWSSPIDEVPIPQAFDQQDFFWRLGLGASGRVGPVELFGEAGGTVGPFGVESEQYIEGLVPDGRETGLDVGVIAGVRIGIG